jgi:hypothetical protein
VRDVLEGLSERRVRRMRERVVEMIPRLVYASSSDGLGDGMEDALDVALRGVLERFRRRRASTAPVGELQLLHRSSLLNFLTEWSKFDYVNSSLFQACTVC